MTTPHDELVGTRAAIKIYFQPSESEAREARERSSPIVPTVREISA